MVTLLDDVREARKSPWYVAANRKVLGVTISPEARDALVELADAGERVTDEATWIDSTGALRVPRETFLAFAESLARLRQP